MPQIVESKGGCHLEVQNGIRNSPCVATQNGDCSLINLANKTTSDAGECRIGSDKNAQVILFKPEDLTDHSHSSELKKSETIAINGQNKIQLPSGKHFVWAGYEVLGWQGQDGGHDGCFGQDCDVHSNGGCSGHFYRRVPKDPQLNLTITLRTDTDPDDCKNERGRYYKLEGEYHAENWQEPLVTGALGSAGSDIFKRTNWDTDKKVSILHPDEQENQYRAELKLDSGDPLKPALEICGEEGSILSLRYLRIRVQQGFLRFCGHIRVEFEGTEIIADPASLNSVPYLVQLKDQATVQFFGDEVHRGLSLSSTDAGRPWSYWWIAKTIDPSEFYYSFITHNPSPLWMKVLPTGDVFNFEANDPMFCNEDGLNQPTCNLQNGLENGGTAAGYTFGFEPFAVTDYGAGFYKFVDLEAGIRHTLAIQNGQQLFAVPPSFDKLPRPIVVRPILRVDTSIHTEVTIEEPEPQTRPASDPTPTPEPTPAPTPASEQDCSPGQSWDHTQNRCTQNPPLQQTDSSGDGTKAPDPNTENHDTPPPPASGDSGGIFSCSVSGGSADSVDGSTTIITFLILSGLLRITHIKFPQDRGRAPGR